VNILTRNRGLINKINPMVILARAREEITKHKYYYATKFNNNVCEGFDG
jgi:hypothetical protein